MPALSTSTYGKGSSMVTSDLADRITAVLASAHAAIGELNSAASTGAPVPQASVNTLTKVLQDLGTLATDARQAAVDDAARDEQARQAAPDTSGAQTAAAGQTSTTPAKGASTGTASTAGTGAAKS